MSMTVYLAGYINGSVIEECIAWRKKIRLHYENWKGGQGYPIEFLDPLNGESLGVISSDGNKGCFPPQMVVHKDYTCVSKSDLIVANMDTFGEARPPIGTLCEVVWAYDLRKSVILISNNEHYTEHPFLKYFSSIIVSSVEELLEKKVLNSFYKSWHSAQY